MAKGTRALSSLARSLRSVVFFALPCAFLWGCATTPEPETEPDPAVEATGLIQFHPRRAQEGSWVLPVRKELRGLIMDGFRTFEGFTGAVTRCLQGGDCTEWTSYAAALVGVAGRAPQDDYVQGQAVYSLVRGGREDLALVILDNCQATEWWCAALRGFALAEDGQVLGAETDFEDALRVMPEELLCEWNDLGPLLTGRGWSAYEGSSCAQRLERSREFWWLTDPAWALPGNDRKVEHYNRMAWATLHGDAIVSRDAEGNVLANINFDEGHSPLHHSWVLRYGMDFYRWDARWGKLCDYPGRWECYPCHHDRDRERQARDRGIVCCEQPEWPWPYCPYTPDAQTFRVIPEEKALLDPFHASAEDWPLVPGGEPENYAPQAGALLPMDAQVAFFERLDSLVATAAVEVPDDPAYGSVPPDSAVLFLGTAPDEAPITANTGASDGRWVFRADAPLRRYVVSIETVTPQAVGRFRAGHGLPQNPLAPLRLSDLLLYTPADSRLEDSTLPDSLEAALPLMKGGHRWRQGEVIGVFLEVYGSEEASSYPVSVELERERGGLARLAEALGIGGGGPANVQWMESGTKGRFALSFTVALGDTEPGNYTLRVSVTGPGMAPAVVEQKVRIVEGRDRG